MIAPDAFMREIVAPGVPDPENVRPSLVYPHAIVEFCTGKRVGAV
jgi:hypothetical protein